MSLKSIAKKVLRRNMSVISYGSEDPKKYSKALTDLVKNSPELKTEKIAMTKNSSNCSFDPLVEKVLCGYDLVNFEIDKYLKNNFVKPKNKILFV